ncbi:DUF6671 family protein [Micromonospora haikouensis]|uniref:DUF6671 family protein n=1 Tax=Micromonospora haikouensis TaxID=686309 RepID=UPI0033E7035B
MTRCRSTGRHPAAWNARSCSSRSVNACARVANHGELVTDGADRSALLGFARTIGLPGHAVTVRPAAVPDGASYPVVKGIVRVPELLAAVAGAVEASTDGRVRVAADLRAHHNPRRMAVIAEAAGRLAIPCPACGAPGFGVAGVETGLPCADCRTPTELAAGRILGCTLCGHRLTSPAEAPADPRWCPRCNP